MLDKMASKTCNKNKGKKDPAAVSQKSACNDVHLVSHSFVMSKQECTHACCNQVIVFRSFCSSILYDQLT